MKYKVSRKQNRKQNRTKKYNKTKSKRRNKKVGGWWPNGIFGSKSPDKTRGQMTPEELAQDDRLNAEMQELRDENERIEEEKWKHQVAKAEADEAERKEKEIAPEIEEEHADHSRIYNTGKFINNKLSVEKMYELISSGNCQEAINNTINFKPNNIKLNFRNDTPLMVAASIRSVKCIKLLLDHNANPNLKNSLGMTALMQAIDRNSNTNETKNLIECVKLLLNAGADVNLQNNDKETALIMAITNKFYDCIELLLQNGADPNLKNEKGRNVFAYVNRRYEPELYQRLLNAGAKD